jgi:5-methylcytosine-specific restriction enzyme subunit McrC
MSIPIRNLYYIFCYAWARFPRGDEIAVGQDDCPDLPNLFAKLLVESTHRLIRRGLDRGYIVHEEETRAPRGKLLINRMIKEQTIRRGAAVCTYDELEHDILHNQILKTTARALISVDTLTPALKHELILIRKQLAAVSDIRLTAGLFRRVQLSRDRYLYGMLMRLCEFVFHSLMPEPGGTSSRFADILSDEARMSMVFEEFLRNFYLYELSEFSVRKMDLSWDAEPLAPGSMAFMPKMETDIVLNSRDRTIVIDAKYYKEILVGRPGFSKKLRSGHLYQLFAYMKHAELAYPGKQIDGALIYPAANQPVPPLDYRMSNHRLRVIAVDLAKPWKEIHNCLLDLPRVPFGTGDGPSPAKVEMTL